MTSIRFAEADRDAAAIAAIYRSSVETGFASFEEVAPTTDEMRRRIVTILARTPWLVATADTGASVIGYAYAGPHRERAGYRWAVDISAYVDVDHQGIGVGSALYDALIPILRAQRFVTVHAGVTQPNEASSRLHRAIGMELVGVYRSVGYKAGAWRDVAWYSMRLANTTSPPEEPIPLPELREARPMLLAQADRVAS